MNKYILGINDMRCGMCELHVEETIKKHAKCKKVKASRFKNNAIVISEEELTENDFRSFLNPTGYRITSFEKTSATKGLFGWK